MLEINVMHFVSNDCILRKRIFVNWVVWVVAVLNVFWLIVGGKFFAYIEDEQDKLGAVKREIN